MKTVSNDELAAIAPHFAQMGYVVRDLAAAETWFRDIVGVPAWTRMENMTFGAECSHRGRPADYAAHLSLGYLGDTQIELIEPLRGESLYAEFLQSKGPGLHHLAFEVPDFEATVDALGAAGLELLGSGAIGAGSRFAYFDCVSAQASVIEILGYDEGTRAFMQQLRKQSAEALRD